MIDNEKNFEKAFARNLVSLGWIEYSKEEIDPESYWCNKALQVEPEKLKSAIERISLSSQPLWKNASRQVRSDRIAWGTYKTILSKQRPTKALVKGVVLPTESLLRSNFELGFVLQLRVKSFDGVKVSIPDVIFYAAGIPIGILELKYGETNILVDKKGEIETRTNLLEAESQLARYLEECSPLWDFIQIIGAADQDFLLVGSRSSLRSRGLTLWSDIGERTLELDLWHPENFRNLILEGLVWSSTPKLVEKPNGSIYDQYIESLGSSIIARRHQFEALDKVKKDIIEGHKDKGTIWHTPGSGKTFTMALCAAYFLKLNKVSENKPIVYIVTDRIDLDDQVYNSFTSWKSLFPHMTRIENIKNRQHAHNEALGLNSNHPIIMTSTIAKLTELDLRNLPNPILVIVDEAHRSHNNQHEGYGKKIRENLPSHVKILGFTGTPLEKSDVSTTQIFGEIIHKFTLNNALKSNIVVDVDYIKKTRTLVISESQLPEKYDANSMTQTIKEIQTSERYLAQISFDIISDWNLNKARIKSNFNRLENKPYPFFAIIACSSREEAYNLYQALILEDGYGSHNIRLIYSSNDSNNANLEFEQYASKHKNHYPIWKEQLQSTYEEISYGVENQIEMIVLVDMWLTGFDAPRAETIYLHKKLESVNFIQTVSRVNRIEKYKNKGRIIDFFNQEEKYKAALEEYISTEQRSILNQITNESINNELEKEVNKICELLNLEKQSLLEVEDINIGQLLMKASFERIEYLHIKNNNAPQTGIFCNYQAGCRVCSMIRPSSNFLTLIRRARGTQHTLNIYQKNLLTILLYLIKFDEVSIRNWSSESKQENSLNNSKLYTSSDFSIYISRAATYANMSSLDIINELQSTWTEVERETLAEDIQAKVIDQSKKDNTTKEHAVSLSQRLGEFGLNAKFSNVSPELEEILKIIDLIDKQISELLTKVLEDNENGKVEKNISILTNLEIAVSKVLAQWNDESEETTVKIPSPTEILKIMNKRKA